MPCYSPLSGYLSKERTVKGKRGIVFNVNEGFKDKPIKVPCGYCIGCKLERARQWSIRIYHEASLYDNNCFITLTYDDSHLPKDGSLVKSDFQKFMKRLRKAYGKTRIRYFHCGEYGERLGRPHYHCCLFNFDFEDKVLVPLGQKIKLYTSDKLNNLWGKGFCTIGDVTIESAAYVARYITKKVVGEFADRHYVDKNTGVIREPEYVTMSRRPGIASDWFKKYSRDVFPCDFVVVNGSKVRTPAYYDKLLERSNIQLHKKIKNNRINRIDEFDVDTAPARLIMREKFRTANLKTKRRVFENG